MKLIGYKTCPACGAMMHLIDFVHTELDYRPASEWYWECYDCGCCIDGDRPDGYDGPDPDTEHDDMIK